MLIESLQWFESALGISVTKGSAWAASTSAAGSTPQPDDAVVSADPQTLRELYTRQGLQWRPERAARCGQTCVLVRDLTAARGLKAVRFALDEPPEWFPAAAVSALESAPASPRAAPAAPAAHPQPAAGSSGAGRAAEPAAAAAAAPAPAAAAAPAGAAAPAAAAPAAAAAAGAEWLPAEDPATGRTYWYNPATQEVTWEPPGAASPRGAPEPEPQREPAAQLGAAEAAPPASPAQAAAEHRAAQPQGAADPGAAQAAAGAPQGTAPPEQQQQPEGGADAERRQLEPERGAEMERRQRPHTPPPLHVPENGAGMPWAAPLSPPPFKGWRADVVTALIASLCHTPPPSLAAESFGLSLSPNRAPSPRRSRSRSSAGGAPLPNGTSHGGPCLAAPGADAVRTPAPAVQAALPNGPAHAPAPAETPNGPAHPLDGERGAQGQGADPFAGGAAAPDGFAASAGDPFAAADAVGAAATQPPPPADPFAAAAVGAAAAQPPPPGDPFAAAAEPAAPLPAADPHTAQHTRAHNTATTAATTTTTATEPAADPFAPAPAADGEQQPAATAEQAEEPAAEAPAGRAAAGGWVEGFDETHNRPYWYNAATQESRWDPPAESGADDDPAQLPAGAEQAAAAAAAPAPHSEAAGDSGAAPAAQPAAAERAPGSPHAAAPGWTVHTDPTSGQQYWVNEALGVSSWHPPSAENGTGGSPAGATAGVAADVDAGMCIAVGHWYYRVLAPGVRPTDAWPTFGGKSGACQPEALALPGGWELCPPGPDTAAAAAAAKWGCGYVVASDGSAYATAGAFAGELRPGTDSLQQLGGTYRPLRQGDHILLRAAMG